MVSNLNNVLFISAFASPSYIGIKQERLEQANNHYTVFCKFYKRENNNFGALNKGKSKINCSRTCSV